MTNVRLLLFTAGQKSLDSEPVRSAAHVTIGLNTLSAVAHFSVSRKSVAPQRERICCRILGTVVFLFFFVNSFIVCLLCTYATVFSHLFAGSQGTDVNVSPVLLLQQLHNLQD